jgi:hypothetical protein
VRQQQQQHNREPRLALPLLELPGMYAARVNGTYIKLVEQKNGKSVHGKVGNNPTYCCWYGPNRKWMVSFTTNKDANEAAWCAESVAAGLDAPQLVEEWNVFLGADAGGWALHPTVTTTNLSEAELHPFLDAAVAAPGFTFA